MENFEKKVLCLVESEFGKFWSYRIQPDRIRYSLIFNWEICALALKVSYEGKNCSFSKVFFQESQKNSREGNGQEETHHHKGDKSIN